MVERLVYTERVGGSNPSPPRFCFRFSIGERDAEMLAIPFAEFSALKEIPPMPVTRFILREHLRDGGLAMNFCRVEQWNPFVVWVAQNQRQFRSGENHSIDVDLCFHAINNR